MTTKWDKSKLEALITNQVEENLNLEYKAAEAIANKKETAKDISAFANSDGGTIIYGIREYKESAKKHLPEVIDPIIDIKAYSKEWIEQIINSNIEPRLTGCIITPVRLKNDSTETIYVIDIPKSSTAHMTDFRYYRRFNFMSVPMHDYEVRDVMNRVSAPTIIITLIPHMVIENAEATIRRHKIDVYATNIGGMMAKYIKVYVYIPTALSARKSTNSGLKKNDILREKYEFDNTKRDNLGRQDGPYRPPALGPSRYEPLLPGMRIKLGEILCQDPTSLNKIGNTRVTVHADNIQPFVMEYELVNSNFHLTTK